MKKLFLASAFLLCILFLAGPAAAQCDPETCVSSNLCVIASCDTVTDECVYTPAADTTVCDDGNVCTVSDVCTGGVCAGTSLPEHTACDDGNSCTINDACVEGFCFGMSLDPGTACASDGNPCTNDVCRSLEGKSACFHRAVADGTVCDVGLPCTIGGVCSAGVCTGSGFAARGTSCEADKPCTDGICNGAGTCLDEPVPAGEPCHGGSCDLSGECIPLKCDPVPMNYLWPPNHKFVPVTLTVPGAAESGVTVDSVKSSEPPSVKGAGGKSKEPDAYLSKTDPLTVFLRSERSGLDKGKSSGLGRLYTISYSATNNLDTTCKGIVKVCVPHDQSAQVKASSCQDSGAKYNAL